MFARPGQRRPHRSFGTTEESGYSGIIVAIYMPQSY